MSRAFLVAPARQPPRICSRGPALATAQRGLKRVSLALHLPMGPERGLIRCTFALIGEHVKLSSSSSPPALLEAPGDADLDLGDTDRDPAVAPGEEDLATKDLRATMSLSYKYLPGLVPYYSVLPPTEVHEETMRRCNVFHIT